MKFKTIGISSVARGEDSDMFRPCLSKFNDLLEQESQSFVTRFGPANAFGVQFVLLSNPRMGLSHEDEASLVRYPLGKLLSLKRNVDYHQFLSSDEAGRLALLARALLEGVLELPKARGLKRFDARGLHEALRSFLVSKGVMEREENL